MDQRTKEQQKAARLEAECDALVKSTAELAARLRKEVEKLEHHPERGVACWCAACWQKRCIDARDEVDKLCEENARLKADVDYERDVKHKLRARVGVLEAEVARLREAGQRCIEISTALAAAGIVGHQNILDVMGAALAAAKGE